MELSLESKTFSRLQLEEVVRQACDIAAGASMPDQIRYLLTYLEHEEAGAQAMLVERPYVDRHFLTEYQGYYATALRDVRRFTTRVHFFTCALRLCDLVAELAEADEEQRTAIQDRLQAAYLGFMVLRPLPIAPVGRTVLRWYVGQDARCFGPRPPPHRVHLLGLRLKAHGIQFHQQDRAVGACATAALWCTLAAVMRRDGGRSPTPLDLTERAIRSVPTSRALPAVAGLTLEQMIGAINASGYSPDVIKPAGNTTLFQLQLMTYVRSGIPVILQVREEGAAEGHAVSLVGFRVADDAHAAEPIEHAFSESYTLRARGMTRLYVHDDRIGPYARMVWDAEDLTDPEDDEVACLARRVAALEDHVGLEANEITDGPEDADEAALEDHVGLEANEVTDGPEDADEAAPAPERARSDFPAIRFHANAAGFENFAGRLRILTAVAPLYPKIRISALDLHSVATEVWPIAAFLAGADDRTDLLLEASFSLGGDYLGEVHRRPLTGSRATRIVTTLFLSRYVGVLRFMVRDRWVLDVLCDATDIHREAPSWSSVLAVIPADEGQVERLRATASRGYPHVVVA